MNLIRYLQPRSCMNCMAIVPSHIRVAVDDLAGKLMGILSILVVNHLLTGWTVIGWAIAAVIFVASQCQPGHGARRKEGDV